jgi:hypothetical protein
MCYMFSHAVPLRTFRTALTTRWSAMNAGYNMYVKRKEPYIKHNLNIQTPLLVTPFRTTNAILSP